MSLDTVWIAVLLSGIAAVLAALALLKSGRSDPALVAEMGTLSERLTAGVNLLRSLLADNSQRERQDAEARARGLREEVINLVTRLGQTTAGSVEQLGQAQSEKLVDTVQRVQSLSEATQRHLIEVKNEAADSGKALREEVNAQLQALLDPSAGLPTTFTPSANSSRTLPIARLRASRHSRASGGRASLECHNRRQ